MLRNSDLQYCGQYVDKTHTNVLLLYYYYMISSTSQKEKSIVIPKTLFPAINFICTGTYLILFVDYYPPFKQPGPGHLIIYNTTEIGGRLIGTGFIDVFCRRATGFHRRDKLFDPKLL